MWPLPSCSAWRPALLTFGAVALGVEPVVLLALDRCAPLGQTAQYAAACMPASEPSHSTERYASEGTVTRAKASAYTTRS